MKFGEDPLERIWLFLSLQTVPLVHNSEIHLIRKSDFYKDFLKKWQYQKWQKCKKVKQLSNAEWKTSFHLKRIFTVGINPWSTNVPHHIKTSQIFGKSKDINTLSPGWRIYSSRDFIKNSNDGYICLELNPVYLVFSSEEALKLS